MLFSSSLDGGYVSFVGGKALRRWVDETPLDEDDKEEEDVEDLSLPDRSWAGDAPSGRYRSLLLLLIWCRVFRIMMFVVVSFDLETLDE